MRRTFLKPNTVHFGLMLASTSSANAGAELAEAPIANRIVTNPLRCNRFGKIFSLAALVILLVFPAPPAQSQKTARREALSEAQLLHLLPVLRAYAASLKQQDNSPDSLSGEMKGSIDARVSLIADIREKRADPQEWIQAHSDYALTPPLLEYDDRCSRLASELSMRPCAVYTFGVEASELGSALLADDRGAIQKILNEGRDQSDSQQRVNAAVASARAFYQKKKFANFQHESPLSWTVVSPGSPLKLSIMEANVYLPWGATWLPSGPLLEFSWNRDPEDDTNGGDAALAQSLPALLKRAKVNEQDFLSFTTALVLARKDSQNPEKLELDPNYVPATENNKRMYEEVKLIVTVRKQNMTLYQRYAGTLDPLLDIFETK
jgi:hypothetical protein